MPTSDTPSPAGTETRPKRTALRIVLGVLLSFLALNAFGGGYYGMAGAQGVPLELLQGSPFSTYFVPSVILFFVVGGSFLTAAIGVFARWQRARLLAFGAAAVVSCWLAVQVAVIGYASWMQPATAAAAVVVVGLAALLPRPAP